MIRANAVAIYLMMIAFVIALSVVTITGTINAGLVSAKEVKNPFDPLYDEDLAQVDHIFEAGTKKVTDGQSNKPFLYFDDDMAVAKLKGKLITSKNVKCSDVPNYSCIIYFGFIALNLNPMEAMKQNRIYKAQTQINDEYYEFQARVSWLD